MATRALPQEQKRLGINLGTVLFILLRIVLAYALMACAGVPGFGFAGAALLLWAALATAHRGESEKSPKIPPCRALGAAMAAVLAFDAPVALLNMVAVQGAASGHKPLVMFGLALSIPLLAFGSAQFIKCCASRRCCGRARACSAGSQGGWRPRTLWCARVRCRPKSCMISRRRSARLSPFCWPMATSRGRRIKRVADE